MEPGTIVIKPENTAVNNGVATGIKRTIPILNKEQAILDFGCGKLRNSRYLKSLGFNISILDKEEQLKRLGDDRLQFQSITAETELTPNSYDVIFCNFVLNVIPNLLERNEVIRKIHFLLKADGIAIFEVRAKEDIMKAKFITEYLDGYLMGKNKVKTFQKPYELNEITTILSKQFNVIESKKYSNSLVVTVKKEVTEKQAYNKQLTLFEVIA